MSILRVYLTVLYIENPVSKQTNAVSVNTNYIMHFADITTMGIYQFINFAKQIPEFRELSSNQQISLIKGAASEAILFKVMSL